MVDLRYKDIETALAAIYGVREEALGAFRARLRHLRNIGVPKLPKVGSGTQIVYTRHHAFELVVALELSRAGVSPRWLVPLAKSAGQNFEKMRKRSPGKPIYMEISGAGEIATCSTGELNLENRPLFRHLTIVNLTACDEVLPKHWK